MQIVNEPPAPAKIFEIAHQSTLNVEVKEFKPKRLVDEKKTVAAKKVSPPSTAPAPPPANKKRATLDKRFIMESTKQIEMQNIDLSKTTGATSKFEEDSIEWVIRGGKRVPIKVTSPPVKPSPLSPEKIAPETTSVPPALESVVVVVAPAQPPPKKSKAKAKAAGKKKHLLKSSAKLEGFVIEEPTFNKTESVKRQQQHQLEEVPKVAEIEEDAEDDDDGLQEAALIEEIPWTEADLEPEKEDIKSKYSPAFSSSGF